MGNDTPKTEKAAQPPAQAQDFSVQNLPEDVALAYKDAQDMLLLISKTAKEAMQTGIEAQRALKEANKKAQEVSSSYKGKIPVKVSLPNKNGGEDVFFFTNGNLSTYRENERKEGEKTHIDKILVFSNGKLASYKEGVITSLNKGSARKDIKIDKSLEYNGISVIYKQGFKSSLGQPVETKKIMRLIFGKPWYLEEGVVEKLTEKPGKIKRRLEFSNNEKTTYSYQENIKTFDETKLIKRALYVEDGVPYRYCEDEYFTKSSFNMFNSYENKKLIYFANGKWQTKATY